METSRSIDVAVPPGTVCQNCVSVTATRGIWVTRAVSRDTTSADAQYQRSNISLSTVGAPGPTVNGPDDPSTTAPKRYR